MLRSCLVLFIGMLAFAPVNAAAQPAPTAQLPADGVLKNIPEAQKYWKECYALCHRNHECNAVSCANQCKGEVITYAHDMSSIGQIMNYNVKAAFAASCLDEFSKYLKKLRDVAKLAQDSALDLTTMIVKVIVDTIIDAVLSQIFDSLTNSICNITTEVLGAVDSFVKNAICLPSASLGNPLDFNLDLGRMKCNGWSIDMSNGQVRGNVVDGISIPVTPPLFNNGAVSDPVLLPGDMQKPIAPDGPLKTIGDPVIVPPTGGGQ